MKQYPLPLDLPETRRCADCQQDLPRSEFYVYPSGAVHSYCKPCHNVRTAAWRRAHPERTKEWEKRNAAERKEYRAGWRAGQRERVIAALGGVCVRCGFTDARALQIDHVNGGGHQERVADQGIRKLYHRILRGEHDGYQLLCANCNWIKRAEESEYRKR